MIDKSEKIKLFKKIPAFSLIEVMLSLIIISVITAAIVPAVTKKFTKRSIEITSDGKMAESSYFYADDCKGLEGIGDECQICIKGAEIQECKKCPLKCREDETLSIMDCQCIKGAIQNCQVCASASKCLLCQTDTEVGNYYPEGSGCDVCPEGYYCNGEKAEICPEGNYCCRTAEVCTGAKEALPCPAGTYAEEGQTACIACEEGSWSTEESSECSECSGTPIEHCTCSDSENVCIKCEDGYDLDEDYICQPVG